MHRKDFMIYENELCRIRKKMGHPDDTRWFLYMASLLQGDKPSNASLLKFHKILTRSANHETLVKSVNDMMIYQKLKNKIADEKNELCHAIIIDLCLAVKMPENILNDLRIHLFNNKGINTTHLNLSGNHFTLNQLLALGIIFKYVKFTSLDFSANQLHLYSENQIRALSPLFRNIKSLNLSNNNLAQFAEEKLEQLGDALHDVIMKSSNSKGWRSFSTSALQSNITNLNINMNNFTQNQLDEMKENMEMKRDRRASGYVLWYSPPKGFPNQLMDSTQSLSLKK